MTIIRRADEIRTEVREDMKGGSGPITIRHYIEKDEFGANVRLCAQLLIPPGAGIGGHKHIDEDEVFIITKGSGLIHDGEKEVPVSSGDVILTGKGDEHALRNDGEEEMEVVAIIACYS